ncbi:hypothetical protein E8E95_24525 [Pseudomonas sp. BN414]|nr:hypothetical protein [Pseudomonas sp. BN414]
MRWNRRVGANSFAMQAEGLPSSLQGAAAQPIANEFAPTGFCSNKKRGQLAPFFIASAYCPGMSLRSFTGSSLRPRAMRMRMLSASTAREKAMAK